jgi:protein-S-isoprenylcysteine O-methyltransferase Ste14
MVRPAPRSLHLEPARPAKRFEAAGSRFKQGLPKPLAVYAILDPQQRQMMASWLLHGRKHRPEDQPMSSTGKERRQEPTNEAPDVAFHPPVVVGLALIVGLVLEWAFPLGPGLAKAPAWLISIGAVVFAAGAVLAGLAIRGFGRAGTSVPTFRPTTALVTTGPYALTRNPIYVGGSAAFAGLGLMLASPWLVGLVIPIVLALHFGVILREEAYLARLFGDAYRDYCRRVPRWLGW